MKITRAGVLCVLLLVSLARVSPAEETNRWTGGGKPPVHETGSMPAAVNPPPDCVLVLPEQEPVQISGFRTIKTGDIIKFGQPARQATVVTLRWDAEGLQVVFDCADDGIVAEQKERDSMKLWKDDCVYIWLDPGHTHNTGATMMAQVSAAGGLHDNRGGDPKGNIEGIVSEVTRTDAGWRARVSLPWKGLGVPCPRPGDVWGVNLTRADHPGRYDYGAMDQSSWSVIPSGDVADNNHWGNILFARKGAKAGDRDVMAFKRAVEEAHNAAKAAEAARIRAKRLAVEPANPNASADAYRVLKFIAGLPERAGGRVMVAQRVQVEDRPVPPGNMKQNYEELVVNLQKSTGKWVPMINFDNDGTPQARGDVAEARNRIAIEYWKSGGLVVMDMHANNPFNGKWIWHDVPPFRGSFDELIKPGTAPNRAWMTCLDKMARNLKELRDAGVVVLWRPFHEMTWRNCWWWDCGGENPESWKRMWRHMFDYFTYERGLNNLLWVYGAANAENYGIPADYCYPGDDYVDIVGLSFYMGKDMAIQGEAYRRLTALGKPFAFTEFGPGGVPTDGSWDTMSLPEVIRTKYPETVYALFWTSWPENKTQIPIRMSVIENRNAKPLLNDPLLLTREGLDWRSVPVPESWVHPPKVAIRNDVIADNGVLYRIPLSRGTLNVQGDCGLQNAKDLSVTQEQGARVFRGTLMYSNLAVSVVQRVSEKGEALQLDLEASAGGQPVPLTYTIQLPTPRFAGGTYAADDRKGSLPEKPLPVEERRFFEGTVGRITFTGPGGLKLKVEMEPAADVYVQDSRRWTQNFSMPVTARTDARAGDGNTRLTIRLEME